MSKKNTVPRIRIGDYYEDCAYHPVRCTEFDIADDTIGGVSLVDGSSPRRCSIRHCGIVKLSKVEAMALTQLWHQKGIKAVMVSKGWSEAEAQKLIDEWHDAPKVKEG